MENKVKSRNGDALRIISVVFLACSIIAGLVVTSSFRHGKDVFAVLGAFLLSGLAFRYIAIAIAEGADASVRAEKNTENILRELKRENKPIEK